MNPAIVEHMTESVVTTGNRDGVFFGSTEAPWSTVRTIPSIMP